MKPYKSTAPNVDFAPKPAVTDDIQNPNLETDSELDPNLIVTDDIEFKKEHLQKSSFFQRRGWLFIVGAIILGLGAVMGWRWWQSQH